MTTHHSQRQRRRLGAAGLAAAVLLGACGSSGDQVDADVAATAVDDASADVADTGDTAVPTTAPVDGQATPDQSSSALTEDQPGMVDEHPELDDAMTDDSMADDAAAETAAAAVGVVLPALPVIDLQSGDTIGLETLTTSEPTLVWFWAPH